MGIETLKLELRKRCLDLGMIQRPDARYGEALTNALSQYPRALWPLTYDGTTLDTVSDQREYALSAITGLSEANQIRRVWIDDGDGVRRETGRWEVTRLAAIPAGTYEALVLSKGPVALWMQDEATGTVAACSTGESLNGAYTGVTLANDTTGPFGTAAPLYDGAAGYLNVKTPGLEYLFNNCAGEFTIAAWIKMYSLGVWSDDAQRFAYQFKDSVSNLTKVYKSSGNNLYFYQAGGGTPKSYSLGNLGRSDWMLLTIVRSEDANRIYYYVDKTLKSYSSGIGTWASSAAWEYMVIGDEDGTLTYPFHGWIGPVAIWMRPLSGSEVAALHVSGDVLTLVLDQPPDGAYDITLEYWQEPTIYDVDEDWLLARAMLALAGETDWTINDPQQVVSRLEYWNARLMARERQLLAQRRRTSRKARTTAWRQFVT